MTWRCEHVQEVRLPLANTEEEYELHRAALEWSLAEPIVLNSAEDIKSRVDWHSRLQPFEHQIKNLFTFCRRLPVTILADDVGLGKTISAGLILSELMVRRRVARTLVVCPKILMYQWLEELDSKFGIVAKDATGAGLKDEFRRRTPVVVTTYDSVRSRLPELQAGTFDMLILDEAHKLRNLYGTEAPPARAARIREALEQRLFKYVLMLTATPLHNRLWDLYSLVDCLTVAKGHRNPLGAPHDFSERFIARGTGGRGLIPERAQEFRAILRQYLVRTRRGDAKLAFPDRKVGKALVRATPEELRLQALVAPHIAALPPLAQISVCQAMMSSPQALALQLENMSKNRPSLVPVAQAVRPIADSLTMPAKLKGLLSLCHQLREKRPEDWRIVVYTLRKETQKAIGQALRVENIPYGFIQGGEAQQNQASIQAFRTDPPTVNVIVSTDAGSEGINLQAANVLVNYDLPWNPMIVEQRIGRIQRLASKHAHVSIWNLAIEGSVEERVVARLLEKLQLISNAVGDIEALLETAGLDGEADDSKSFEHQILELVVQSLAGQDVNHATALAEQSISEAKVILESQRTELDQTLGDLNTLHQAGPNMPKLARKPPRMSAQDFVLAAKKVDGARITELAPRTYDVRFPGRNVEVITFDEDVVARAEADAVFMGNAPKAYLPGKPPFERMTQQWLGRAGHRVHDLREQSPVLAEKLARQWCSTISGTGLAKADFSPDTDDFQGRLIIRARANNAVDSYEKLILG